MALEMRKDPEQDMGYVHDWYKVKRVIDSCTRPEHFKQAERMIENYGKKYPGSRYNISRHQLELEFISKRDNLGYYE